MAVAIGLVLVLGFWLVSLGMIWILGADTGVTGYLHTVSGTTVEKHPGTVTISRGGVIEATSEATAEDGFSIETEPGTYQLAGTLADGGSCVSQTFEVPDRGFTEITLSCRPFGSTSD